MKNKFKKLCGAILINGVLLLSGTQIHGQNIYTIAGNGTAGYNGDGRLATSAELNTAGDLTTDDSGNIYISDAYNYRIRKITLATGIINTIAGNGNAGYMGDGSAAINAEINVPYGIAVDDSGNVYFADGSNNVVRKVTLSTGIISTIAGDFVLGAGFNGDNIVATGAQLYQPTGVALDDSGNVFIGDFRNQRIREVRKATGIITTVAGDGIQSFGGDNGAAVSAQIDYPGGIAIDDSNNIYIADAGNNRIRKVTAKTGIITTIAGNGVSAYAGDNGPATNASMQWCVRVGVDDSGNVYIGDQYDDVIRKVTKATGIIKTFAGNGVGNGTQYGGFSGDGGPATAAELSGPTAVAADNCGDVYIADYNNYRIREVIGPVPIVSVSPDSLSMCSGASDTLRASGSGNYTWSPAAGLSATMGSMVIVNPTITTTYTITGGSIACPATKTVVVTVVPVQPLNILPQPGPLFCSGLNAELKVQGGGSNFIWTPTTGLSDTTGGDSVLAAPLVTTTYYVAGYDSLGCYATGSEKVTVIASPNKPTFYQHGDTLTSSAITDNQWYRNDTLLLNDTSQNLIIYSTSHNEYYVVVENEANGCSTSSDTVTTTGIKEVSAISDQLSIYPNPFNNDIVIKINSSAGDISNWNLQIIDVLGRTVYSERSLNYSNDIDLSDLSSGVYFITVINKSGRAVIPVIKQN